MTPVSLTFLEFRFTNDVARKSVHRVFSRTECPTLPEEAVAYVYYDRLGFNLPDGSFESLGQPTNHSPMHFIDGVLIPVDGDMPYIRTRHGMLVPFEPCVLV